MASDGLLVEARTVNASSFRILSESFKSIFTEVSMVFDSEGIKMTTVNKTKTLITSMQLHADKFQVYRCAKKVDIGFETDNFYKLLKKIGKDDVLTLQVHEDNPNELCIIVENAEDDLVTRNTLKLLDTDRVNSVISTLGFPCVLTLPSSLFQKIVRDIGVMESKTISLTSVGESLIFSSKCQFSSHESTLGNKDNDVTIERKGDQIIQGTYLMEHLSILTKCSGLCKTIEIYMKNDNPLTIKYAVASLGEITFSLLPIPVEQA
jgi:proliferating cell nuclear antigen PCNA